MRAIGRSASRIPLACLAVVAAAGWSIPAAGAHQLGSDEDGGGHSLTATVFAVAPPVAPGQAAKASKPDDITRLGDLVYVAFQNNAGKDGSPAGSYSTIAAYRVDTGALTTTYQVPGRVDGLTADPTRHRLLATVNEDNNSSLYVIHPSHPQPEQYLYRPDPAETGTDGTNGGTDAISVAPDGTLYVAHSNPDVSLPAPNNTAAVYTMTLSGHTASMTRLFGVNDIATVINPGPGQPKTAPLALTDPDSNRYLNTDGGTLIQVAQGDSKLVLATDLHTRTPELRQLLLTNAMPTSTGQPAAPQLDDVAPVGGPGRLLVVDQKAGIIYSINTRGVRPGTVFASQPAPTASDLPNDPALSTVNLTTGVVTHLNLPFASPKGLLPLPADDHEDSDQ